MTQRVRTLARPGLIGIGLALLVALATSAATALAGQLGAPTGEVAAQPGSPRVDRDEALRRGSADAKLNHFNLQGLNARVDDVSADLITLGDADHRLNGQRSGSQDGNKQVWWVTVRGSFQGRGEGGNAQNSNGRIFIYDAETGRLLGMRSSGQ